MDGAWEQRATWSFYTEFVADLVIGAVRGSPPARPCLNCLAVHDTLRPLMDALDVTAVTHP